MMLRYFFLTAVLWSSCLVSKKNDNTLLYGDWYGGPGEKYSESIKPNTLIQRLPAEHLLFTYNTDHTFFHSGRGTKISFMVVKNKIYYDIEKPEQKRYYFIEKLSSDSLIVTGPYVDKKSLYTDDKVVYRLRYYRKR